jgi:hypothetical protein
MPTSFGGRSIYTSWGVTLFCPTCAEQVEIKIKRRHRRKTARGIGTIVCAFPRSQDILLQKISQKIQRRRRRELYGTFAPIELPRSDFLPACRSRTRGQSRPGRLPQSRTSRPGRCCQTDKCSGSRPWTREDRLSITITIFKLIQKRI